MRTFLFVLLAKRARIIHGFIAKVKFGFDVETEDGDQIMSTKSSADAQPQDGNLQQVLSEQLFFVYLPGSKVYHSAFCPHALHAKQELCIYSGRDFARKKLRPCKYCAPMIARQRAAFTKAIPTCPKHSDDQWRRSLVNVRLITGLHVEMQRRNIVGCCHCATHPGKLTKQLMLDHNCIEKECRYFEKYDYASYWRGKQQIQQAKERKREEQKKVKEREKLQSERLKSIQQEMQVILDDLSYSMEIIRLEQIEAKRYKVFYVSDYPFADGNRFPDFLGAIYATHPGWRIWLQHIKDMDGRFVTRSMYHAIKR